MSGRFGKGPVGTCGGPPRSLRGSSLGLILGKMAQMLVGFLFWLIAARLAQPYDVGLAAALVSAVMLCTQLAHLGVGASFIRSYPSFSQKPHALLNTAFSVVAMAALACGVSFLLLGGEVLAELHGLARRWDLASLFVLIAVLGTVNVLLDQISMAQGRGEQVLGRNALGAAVMITPLLAVSAAGGNLTAAALFASWAAGGVSVSLLGALQLRNRLSYYYRPRITTDVGRRLLRIGLPNHALTLTERVPGLVLPLLITAIISPTATAHWYPIWMMAWALYVTPISVGIATFAEATRNPETVRESVRRSIKWSVQLGVPGGVAIAIFAKPALSLLGGEYADAGTDPLRVLLLALVPMTFVQAYFSVARAAGRMAGVVTAGVVVACGSLIATTYGGMRSGLMGMALGWVVAQTLAGVWAGYLLTRRLRPGVAMAVESGVIVA
jgi:O-antigen/teichoic acid export membrane protein